MTTRRLGLREPSEAKVEAVGGWLESVKRRRRRIRPCRVAYLLLTPLGSPQGDWLAEELSRNRILVKRRTTLHDWPLISTALQARGVDGPRLRQAALYEAAWRRLFPGGVAEAWEFSLESHAWIEPRKRDLRACMNQLRVELPPGRNHRMRLHAFHLPDAADVEREGRTLGAALELLAER